MKKKTNPELVTEWIKCQNSLKTGKSKHWTDILVRKWEWKTTTFQLA